MSSRLKISLALLVGFVGLAIAGANLPVDTQLTIRTKLGKRTQPHWLVPADSKIVRTEGGSGLFRLAGGLLGCVGFATAMHLAGSDEKQQRLFWSKQVVLDGVDLTESEVSAQIKAGVRLKKLQMDAQADVDFYSLQIQGKFREAIGYVPIPVQPALPYGKPGTLNEVTNPGDKVDEYKLEAIEPTNEQPQIPNLTWYPSVLIYGAPGSGKSTFAADEIAKRKAAGHRVIALDPHAAYGAWDGCEIVGGGMDYAAIDAKLAWFASEVMVRYKRVQSEPSPKFEPLTFVCDEFTRWGNKCANSAEFFEQLVTDIRKVEMFGIIVSHTRTLAGLANAKGFASLRDEAFLEVEILGNQGENGRATPRFEAMVKLPGCALRDRFLVKIQESPITPSHTLPTPSHTSAPETLTPLSHKASGSSHQLHHPIPESWKFGNPKVIDSATRGVIVACVRCGWSQTRTIQEVFGLAKGGTNSSYDLARIAYQEIYRLIH